MGQLTDGMIQRPPGVPLQRFTKKALYGPGAVDVPVNAKMVDRVYEIDGEPCLDQ